MLKRSLIHCMAACAAAGVLVAWLLPTPRVSACTYRPSCVPIIFPSEGATLPANHTTIGIRGCVDRSSIAFSVERDGSSTPVDFEQEAPTADWTFMGEALSVPLHWTRLNLRTPLSAADTLVLRYETERGEELGPREVEVRWPVGEEEQLPEELGTLDVSTHDAVITVSANVSCSRDMRSRYADVTLQPTEEARAWLPRIRYELRVDEIPWMFFDSLQDQHTTGTWHSSLGPGKDRVILGCEVDPHRPVIHDGYVMPQALEPGSHRVRMVGFLASGVELSSQEVVVDLQCAPDSARALKAELDAYKESRIGSQSSPVAADCGDEGCTVAALGGRQASVWPALVLAGLCLTRFAQRYRARSREE